MTVSTTEAFVQYEGDGSTVEFTFDFPSFEVDWMFGLVDRVPTPGSAVLNLDQNENPGGVFTFEDAPADESEVTVLRLADFLQLTDYPPFTKFPAESHEAALDKLTMVAQQLAYAIFLLEGDASLYVLRAGDTMLGQLNTLPPVDPNNAVNKTYTDDEIADLGTNLQGQINALDAAKANVTVSILTADPQTLVIDDPTLAGDVTITTRTNIGSQIIPEGLVKTDPTGLIPAELLPPAVGGALNLIGVWDAGPGDNPVDAENQGDTYLISNPGTLFIFRVSTGLEENIDVNISDAIVWITEPNDQGFDEGWYYLPLTLLPRQASSILVDDTLWPYVAGQVQEAFDTLFTSHLGTAATEDVQTTPDDVTAGAVMTVGAFGLGDVALSTTDLDVLGATGYYGYAAAATGAPAAFDGVVQHIRRSVNPGDPTAVQQATDSQGNTYIRQSVDDVFGTWNLVAVNGSSPTFTDLNVDNDAGIGGALNVTGNINANGGILSLINPTTPANTSTVQAGSNADRQYLELLGALTTVSAFIRLHGASDANDPDAVIIGTGNAASPAVRITSANEPQCIDKAGNMRRMGWSPNRQTLNSGNFTEAHLGNTVQTAAGGLEVFNIPGTLGDGGDMIQFVNFGSSASKTISPTAGGALTWMRGDGTTPTGPRTIGPGSVCTLMKSSASGWAIWGNSIG